ncbi:uncharacterized protein (TIGR02448 family) [Pseudomonas sp. PvP001]
MESRSCASKPLLLPSRCCPCPSARPWPIPSGATCFPRAPRTGSSYLTFKDHKLIIAAQDDAGSFVASEGGIRGPYLEAAIQKVRAQNPGLEASDMDLANAILAKNAVADN